MAGEKSGGVGNFWYSFDYGLTHFISIDGETDFPYWQPVFGVRVENSEFCRPEHLPDVNNVRDEGVSYSFRHWQLLSPTDCSTLSQKRDYA